MKLKKPVSISVLVVVLVGLFLYFTSNKMHMSKEQSQDDYISFCTLTMKTYDETNDQAEYGAAVYEYNLQSGATSEIFNFPLSAMYPLGVYDKKANAVYYVKEAHNDTYERMHRGDQIYVHNLKTSADKMLTNDLLAVNHIVPIDGAIFFVAARQNNPDSLSLGKIDLSSGNIQYWDEDDTASTLTISVDRINKRIYVAQFSSAEQNLAMVTGTGFDSPKHTIYSFDFNLKDKREILHKDNMAIKTVYAMDNKLLYSAHDTMSPSPDTQIESEILDVSNMNVLYQSNDAFPLSGCFARNAKDIYSIKSIQNNSETSGDNEICLYTPETQEYRSIIRGNFGSIANFLFMYYPE